MRNDEGAHKLEAQSTAELEELAYRRLIENSEIAVDYVSEKLAANYAKHNMQQPDMQRQIAALIEDPRYLNFFRTLSAAVSNDAEIQEDFWRLITTPISGQITYEAGVNEFFMHMLSAVQNNKSPIAQQIDKEISSIIEADPTKYSVSIRKSGYINANIIRALFDLIKSEAPVAVKEKSLSILDSVEHKVPLYKSEEAPYSFELLFEILEERSSMVSLSEETKLESKEDEDELKEEGIRLAGKEIHVRKSNSGYSWRIEFYKLDLLDRLMTQADETSLPRCLCYITPVSYFKQEERQ
jgi:hypothetical protein